MKALFSRITLVLACSAGLLLSSPLIDTASALRDCENPPGDAGDIRITEDGPIICEAGEDGVYRWTPLRPPAPLPPGFPTIDPPAQVAPPVPISPGPTPTPAPTPAPTGPAPAVAGGGAGACAGAYAVTVAMDPSRPTTLRMDYGDTGAFSQIETRTIPQGTGSVSFRFTHEFNPSIFHPEPFVVQKATVVETGASGKAYTLHAPASLRDPDQPPTGT